MTSQEEQEEGGGGGWGRRRDAPTPSKTEHEHVFCGNLKTSEFLKGRPGAMVMMVMLMAMTMVLWMMVGTWSVWVQCA